MQGQVNDVHERESHSLKSVQKARKDLKTSIRVLDKLMKHGPHSKRDKRKSAVISVEATHAQITANLTGNLLECYNQMYTQWAQNCTEAVQCAETLNLPADTAGIMAYMTETNEGRGVRVRKIFKHLYYDYVLAGTYPSSITPQQAIDLYELSRRPHTADMQRLVSDSKRSRLGKRRLEAALRANPTIGNTVCPQCSQESMHQDKGSITCQSCGFVGSGITDNVSFVQRSHVNIRRSVPYKRKTHFNDHLDFIQGEGRVVLPLRLQMHVLEKLQSRRLDPINRPEEITYFVISDILRDLDYTNLFQTVPSIIKLVTGRPPAAPFTEKEKSALLQLFEETQEPFEKFKGDRINFLSYKYVMHKYCEMLGIDRYLPMLSFFKSSRNLMEAEYKWKQICIYNQERGLPNWRFIPATA